MPRYDVTRMGSTKRAWQGGQEDETTEPEHTGQPMTPPGGPAVYMGPDQGPFKCGNCEYFDGVGHCSKPEVVQELGNDDDQDLALVDAEGCCNYFEKGPPNAGR
jgi:hypothetical protein